MEKKVMLPFPEEPLSISYQYSAFVIGIIEANAKKDITPWLCSRYIDCTFRENYADKFSISFYDHFATYENVLINEKVSFQIKTIEKLNINIISLIKTMLSNQKYIYGHYNEKYVPGKKSFEKKYRYHDFLLIGYDDFKEVFISVGYLADEKFQKFEIPYKNMMDALLTLDTPVLSIDIFSFNSSFIFSFDLEKILLMLENYIKSEVSSFEKINGHFYGIDSIKELSYHFKKTCLYTSDFKIKYTKSLLEHKKFMFLRIKYLCENGYLNEKYYVEQASVIFNEAKLIHLMGMKYRISKQKTILNDLCEKILEINEMEQKYLKDVIRDLKLYNTKSTQSSK